MAKKNLWGDIPTHDLLRTPYHILREQASFLGEMTGNLLEGHVRRSKVLAMDVFRLDLSIVAPTLDNYAYTVLHAEHNINLYPVYVSESTPTNRKECKNEAEFVEAVGSILSSDKVRKVIVSLLSQIKAEV